MHGLFTIVVLGPLTVERFGTGFVLSFDGGITDLVVFTAEGFCVDDLHGLHFFPAGHVLPLNHGQDWAVLHFLQQFPFLHSGGFGGFIVSGRLIVVGFNGSLGVVFTLNVVGFLVPVVVTGTVIKDKITKKN